MADFSSESDAIDVGDETQLDVMETPLEVLSIHAIVYIDPWKHFISVQHFSSCHTTCYCHSSTPLRPPKWLISALMPLWVVKLN